MFLRVSILLFQIVAIHSVCAAIDFTPTLKEYSAQGFTYRQVKLKNDQGSVTFSPPQGWTVSGGKDRLQLTPPDRKFVEATIQATPLQAPQPFDEATVKALQQRSISEAPPGSQSVQLLKSQENPVRMDQSPSFEFVISYQALGQTFQRSVIFVNFPDMQLVLRFTAPKADFETLDRDFLRSISTWQWLKEPATSGAAPVTASK